MMAQCSSLKHDFPAITRGTLESSLQDIKAQYMDLDEHTKFIPQVVYLKELPSYNDFFAKLLVPNQLCVLTEAATIHWRSRQEWVCQDGSPNIDFLQRTFGDATVPVANCKSKEFSAHTKEEMKMREFLTYWQQHREAGHPPHDNSLYLKDWHFTRDFPDYEAYSTCSFFRSDWMNEFWDVREDIDDDYRFVYMGPKNTWTPFHADVFRSFSWSANICGRKRWIFFPPGEEEHLKDVHGSLVYDVTSKELEDPLKFPNACRVQHRIEIIQCPGETIFVPSGWHHQVENLEDTISINHNWLNGCNVRQCWVHLRASLTDVEHEISDCRDMDGWHQQCQTILRALTGLDYDEFFRFMTSVALKRIHALNVWQQKARDTTPYDSAFPRSRHDANNQSPESVSVPSEPCVQTKDDRDMNRTSPELHQHEEDMLNLCEGGHLNGEGPNPRHWSHCNVNHALFDLASIAMVLRDMRRHQSVTSLPETEQHRVDNSKSEIRADIAVHEIEKENKHCSQEDTSVKWSEHSECPTGNSCSIVSLLKEISQCLSAFRVEGDWES